MFSLAPRPGQEIPTCRAEQDRAGLDSTQLARQKYPVICLTLVETASSIRAVSGCVNMNHSFGQILRRSSGDGYGTAPFTEASSPGRQARIRLSAMLPGPLWISTVGRTWKLQCSKDDGLSDQSLSPGQGQVKVATLAGAKRRAPF